jgi:nitrite reductase/ring-hydroxylating ferredoxin subunit
MNPVVSRRGVLLGGGLCTLAICGVAGCASYGPEDEPASSSAAAPLTLPTADVPVGGGRIFDAQKVVVTQPTAGRFKAFSAVCTHQGCTLGQVAVTINCPCHGSRFSITDGSVVQGPATTPLPAYPVKVSGAEVTVG